MKIKTVIVEDEELIRSLIRASVEWETLGFEITGEAADGETAIEIIERNRPHLIILDINIPIVGGLEVARRVREMLPKTKILILTGYERFDYAQEAIRLGVVNYLLKPINESVLEAELIQVRDDLLRYEEHVGRDSAHVPVWRNWNAHPERLSVVAQSWESYRLVIFEIDPDIPNLLVEGDASERYANHVSVLQMIFPESPVIPSTMRDRFLCIVPDPRATIDTDSAITKVRSAIRTVATTHRLQITASLSGKKTDPQECAAAILEAETAANDAFFGTRGIVYEASADGTRRVNETLLVLERVRERLVVELRLGKDCGRTIDHVFDQVAETLVTRDAAYLVALETVNIALIVINEVGLSFGDLFPGVHSVAALIYGQNSLWALRRVCGAIYRIVAETIGGDHASPTVRIAYEVRKYIEKQFRDPRLSLDQIASSVERHPSYVSTIFKQNTGSSVTEYITKCRLEYAKRKMTEEPLTRIQEIAEECGYYDPYYFSKAFKKAYGLSPRKYISQVSDG